MGVTAPDLVTKLDEVEPLSILTDKPVEVKDDETSSTNSDANSESDNTQS